MLSESQLTTLSSAITNDATALAFWQGGNPGAVADYFNAAAEPVFIVWRTSVTQDEIMQNGFDWTRVDNLSVGAARVWEWLFANEEKTVNPSKMNVRAGIEAVWKGTAADLAVRASVYLHCKREATKAEALFAEGVGTQAAPANLVYEGDLSFMDVIAAMNQGA